MKHVLLTACLLFVMALGAAYVRAATTNTVPKYAADGSLLDSAISEGGGKVGIGTTSPDRTLTVAGTLAGMHIQRAGADAYGPFIQFDHPGKGHTWYLQQNVDGETSGMLAFYTTADATTTMTLLENGNVGIGTTSPSAKLHVAGDVTVDGNIAAKYQDVAEWVDSIEPLEAGMLVVIDRSGDNRVSAAKRSYNLRVAGAVSASPGVILGEPGRGKVLVAQSGRLRIKADASYGAIHVGDLLVSSPTKGAAMRSEPIDVAGVKMHRPGTVIGKALESLDEGIGEILVLLTLQ